MDDFGTKLEIGIGVNFGKAFVGHLGHPKHRQFAVVGDPVNIASRIQGLTKETGCQILISNSILKGIEEGTLVMGKSFVKRLKGVEGAVKLHHVMGFKETDINLELQSSLDFIMENSDEFAEKFYARVFELAPSVKSLFKSNMMMQGRMLMHMLVGIVYSLSRPEHLILGLKSLGKSHVKYGVKPEHYPVVKQALLETIEKELGEHCTPRVLEAWDKALEVVTQTMRDWDRS